MQCCAILIGIGVISVLKSKIFDTFGIVSVLVLKEVCKRYWYWSRYCKKSLRGIGIGIGIETWRSHGIGIVLVSTYGYVKYWYRFEETYHICWDLSRKPDFHKKKPGRFPFFFGFLADFLWCAFYHNILPTNTVVFVSQLSLLIKLLTLFLLQIFIIL